MEALLLYFLAEDVAKVLAVPQQPWRGTYLNKSK